MVETKGRVLREALQLKVDSLQPLLDECPPVMVSVSAEIKLILKAAPRLLEDR